MKIVFGKLAGLGAIAGAMMMATGAMAAPAGAGAGAMHGAGSPMVSAVAGGCGHGMYRAANGRCYRAGVRPPHVMHRPAPPRHMHAPHRRVHCYTQRTPHGPRRVCR